MKTQAMAAVIQRDFVRAGLSGHQRKSHCRPLLRGGRSSGATGACVVGQDHPDDVIASRQVGRNDPCPCGSSKKYKKCCGAS